MAYTVSEVAEVAGVSVRTLHHYDEIGLLPPSGRSDAGYRLYSDRDLERLQQVLFFRELGFPLEEIARILNAPSFDRREALRMQRELLSRKKARMEAMIGAVDAALDAMERGRTMTKEEMLKVFDGFDPTQYEGEVRERWGETDAYKESARRTKGYTKKDWEAIKREGEAIGLKLAALMDAGKRPDTPEAMAAVEEHRLHISKWFYPCSKEMHRCLGEGYVTDPRFTANIDKVRSGLARFWRDAIIANSSQA